MSLVGKARILGYELRERMWKEAAMQRRYELIDMVVIIGFCAIAAVGILYAAANGMITISLAENISDKDELLIMGLDDVRWLQPILGQAIVDRDLLDRRHAIALSVAEIRLEEVSAQYTRAQKSPFSYLDSIRTSAIWAKSDHATRVQTVMGHAIVQFTGRGLRSDMLSSEGDALNFNARMIAQADARRQQMDADFLLDWQANLGRAIVAATQTSTKTSSLAQERLGAAIMQLTTVQSAYDAAHAVIQEHLRAATLVATRLSLQNSIAGPTPL